MTGENKNSAVVKENILYTGPLPKNQIAVNTTYFIVHG
jgi:hypothetical protein